MELTYSEKKTFEGVIVSLMADSLFAARGAHVGEGGGALRTRESRRGAARCAATLFADAQKVGAGRSGVRARRPGVHHKILGLVGQIVFNLEGTVR